jgi:hypothetical protein
MPGLLSLRVGYLSQGLPQPQPAPSDAKSDWPEVRLLCGSFQSETPSLAHRCLYGISMADQPLVSLSQFSKPMCTCCCFVPHSQVLQLHADSTSASVSWADYSHGALSGLAAPPHSPVYGQQGSEFDHGDAADSPGSMSAMLTWAGAGMKQLASKLLGSGSLTDSQQVQAVQLATSLGCLCCHGSAM